MDAEKEFPPLKMTYPRQDKEKSIIIQWRTYLESKGFTQGEANSLIFLKWSHSRRFR
jgi:hypothetical protein